MKKKKDTLSDTEINLFTIRHTAFMLVKHNNVKFGKVFEEVKKGIICALRGDFE